MSTKGDDHEKAHQEHAQLMKELPKVDGWWAPEIVLYQGYWFFSQALLGVRLMQQSHFKPQSTDIVLSAFMKCGTTWLRSLMFSILNRSRFDFSDHPLHHQGPHDCFPQLEVYLSQHYPFTNVDMDVDLPSPPRLFATHIPHALFPSSITDSCKFVYVCRDPKDVFVSLFHFWTKLRSKERPPLLFNEAFEMFCQGVCEYGPFWDHVLGFWKASLESPNKILFFKYEDMKKDPGIHVKRLAEFMGVPFSAQEEEDGAVIENIVNFCSFHNMKNLDVNKSGLQRFEKVVELENSHFFRRGEVGDWENHLTEEMRARIDGITREKFKGSGLIIGTTTLK